MTANDYSIEKYVSEYLKPAGRERNYHRLAGYSMQMPHHVQTE